MPPPASTPDPRPPDGLPEDGLAGSSAFARGWEYRRRGWPLERNPYRPGTWQAEAFTAGWQQFRAPKLRPDPGGRPGQA